jgi:hypothetical protein
MSIFSLGDFPIDPNIVDGTELANRLNRMATSVDSLMLLKDASGNIYLNAPHNYIGASNKNYDLNSFLSQSVMTNGYQKLPGGMIIQWGAVPAIDPGIPQSITFPISFSVQAFAVVGNFGATAVALTPVSCLTQVTTPSAVIFYNWGTVKSVQGSYIAIGY